MSRPLKKRENVKKSVIVEDKKLPKDDPKREKVLKDETQNTIGKLNAGERKVGMSQGVTINMGNYESAKINIWIEQIIEDSDDIEAKTIANISKRLEEYLKAEVQQLIS